MNNGKPSKSYPYIRWYHGDFLRETQGWKLLEQAALWKLICLQWESGPIPNEDPMRVAVALGISMRELRKLWPTVSKRLKLTDTGWVHPATEAHRLQDIEYRREQSERGHKGMAVRYGKGSNVIPLPTKGGGRDG